MKIYVASKFEKKDMVIDIYKQLTALGYTIAYDWTTHKPIKPYIENQELARQYSDNELKGISECDIFLMVTDENAHTMLMELGAALVKNFKTGKPLVYAIGKWNDTSPWFFNKRVKRFETIKEAIEEIKKVHT
jgi:hypothetical protein